MAFDYYVNLSSFPETHAWLRLIEVLYRYALCRNAHPGM